jgi:multidrug efflux pump subunit AcrA (membrane-fusion protein)
MAPSMRKRSLLLLVVMTAIALIVILRFSGKNASAERDDEVALRPAAVALAEPIYISDTITLSGEFRPFQEVDVHAKVAGYIRKIYVDVGDHVKNGQALAVLEVPELDAQLQGAGAAIRRSKEYCFPAG